GLLAPAALTAQLERKLQAQLNRTWSARTYGGICRGYVWRGAAAAEWTNRGIIQAETVLTAVRVSEVGMVENVEELDSALEPHGLSKVEILGYGKIEVPEAGVLEHVAAHISELAKRWRKHDGTAVGIAAKQIQSGGRSSHCSSVHGCGLRHAGWVGGAGEVGNSSPLLRLEVGGLSVEAPTNRRVGRRAYGQRADAGCIGSFIHRPPRLRALQRDDGVELPAFAKLSEALLSGDRIGERHGQPVPDVEIAAGILGGGVVRVLRQAGAVAEIPVCAHIIEGVRIRVARDHAQAVVVARVQCDLKSVVVRAVDVAHLENV